MKNYSLPWVVGMVTSLHETYPRGTTFLEELLEITTVSISQAFLQDTINWYEYKKLLRSVDELLYSRIVVDPGKVYNLWERRVKLVDTPIDCATLGERKEI